MDGAYCYIALSQRLCPLLNMLITLVNHFIPIIREDADAKIDARIHYPTIPWRKKCDILSLFQKGANRFSDPDLGSTVKMSIFNESYVHPVLQSIVGGLMSNITIV
jgi:hypothetical protein